jgi:Zn-dependent protease with chaperone function
MEIKVHRKENFYYWLMVAISIIFYSMLTFKFINSPNIFSSDIFKSPLIVISIYYLGIFLFFSLFSRICFLGHLRGNSVKLTPTQFPELFKILKSHCQKLGMSSIPDTYVMQGNGILNAFAARIFRNNLVILNSGIVELIADNEFDVVSFIIGHELGHIKRGHVSFKQILTFPASVIIFPLRLAYSRAREYTCDNIGYNLCPAGAVNGILFICAGAKLYKKVNVKELFLSLDANSGFATKVAEFFSTHPLLIKRVRALNDLNHLNLQVDSFSFNTPKNTKFEELS